MSRFFGAVRQNGYVVTDLERAIDGWLAAGVGPWIVHEHLAIEGFAVRGVPGHIDATIALANSGPLQLELIRPNDDAPSLYREFLTANPNGGLHHLGYWAEDFDATSAAAQQRGWRIGQEGTIWGGRFAYFDNEHHPGSVVELIELDAARADSFARLEQLCASWDGTDRPVRVIPPR